MIGYAPSDAPCASGISYATPYAEVIGDPVSQSKSPLIHRFWLDSLGIEGRYHAQHVCQKDLASYIAVRREDANWRGCSVTMPHKQAVLDLVDDPQDIRSTIGAMNIIYRSATGNLVGGNTDVSGFLAPLARVDPRVGPASLASLAERNIIVIGAGGAARAVLFALASQSGSQSEFGPQSQPRTLSIFNRDTAKAAKLLVHFGIEGCVFSLNAPLPSASLLVNASSLGMKNQPPLDVDLAPLADDCLVYDLVYSPIETQLLRRARERRLAVIDGLEMLIGQAALAFEKFFGIAPPYSDTLSDTASGAGQAGGAVSGAVSGARQAGSNHPILREKLLV